MMKDYTPVKILVVDDNPKNIQVVGTILREAGYEVGFAFDGNQALDLLFNSKNYDLVLLDIKMPVLNGIEVCKEMQRDTVLQEIPVIFISASNEAESIILGFDSGGVDYITKPFNAKELLARVNTHVLLKRTSKELKNYALELEKLNATKDKFFSIIAHDLRNPFEGIMLVTRTLLRQMGSNSTEEIKNQVEMIATTAENGNNLLENLLVWSKSQTGHITYTPSKTRLDLLIHKCLKVVTPHSTAKNIKLTCTTDQDVMVNTDQDMFCHILRNLMTNAIKFTPENGSVIIRSQKVSGGISISVSDSGMGISESDLNRLFRIDGNVTSRRGTQNEKGSGLGLILCREFADKMGGTITVESEIEKGSRFTLFLPDLQ
jgi:two-component system, sensor histidine kinase and response regulator